MSLDPKHLNDLQASGLSDCQIAAAGLYTETDPNKVQCLLNWENSSKNLGHCLVIPYRDRNGSATEYNRLKPSRPRTSKKNDRTRIIKYEAPRGVSNRPYFPPGTIHAVNTPKELLLITEGEKKALKADECGFPTIGLSGVWSWQQKRDRDANNRPIGQRCLIPGLAEIDWKDRDVVIVFDSDAATNKNIRHAESELKEAIEFKGAHVGILRLPSISADEKVGLDDFLISDRADQLRGMVENAVEVAHLNELPIICQRIENHVAEGPTGIFLDEALLTAVALCSIHRPDEYSAVRGLIRSQKISLRDFDRALSAYRERALKEIPPIMKRGDSGGYFVCQGKYCRSKLASDGPQIIPICNFTAQIVGEVFIDDGAEKQLFFQINGQMGDLQAENGCVINGRDLPTILVSASDFGKLKWIHEQWGSDPIVYAGEQAHICPAIQCLTEANKKSKKIQYVHTGWIKQGSQNFYLHAEGAIGGKASDSSLSVSLEGPLSKYKINPLSSNIQVKEAITRVYSLLGINDESDEFDPDLQSLLFVLVSAVFRAAIKTADFGLHLCGPSGVFKSELAALAQQFFGKEMNARNLPGSWTSTVNSNESLAFLAKDALLVIDDFAPTASDIGRLHRDADRLFRNQGNNAGRGRSRTDGSRLPDRPPRGLILSTGEDIPKGHSLRARLLVIEIVPGLIDKKWLSICQSDAHSGVYSGLMHAFIKWLSLSRQRLIQEWPAKIQESRGEFLIPRVHSRTSGIAAELFLGFRAFTGFAVQAEALSEGEREKLNQQCRQALIHITGCQDMHQNQNEPAEMFLDLLCGALNSGRAHLTDLNGDMPNPCTNYGWHKIPDTQGQAHRPGGPRIGWIDHDGIYLDADSTFAAIQALAREQGDAFPITKNTLWKRLKEKELLGSFAENRIKIQKQVERTRKWVIHLIPDALGQTDAELPSII